MDTQAKYLSDVLAVPEPDNCVTVTYEQIVDIPPVDAQKLFTKVVWEGLGFQTVPGMNMLPGAHIVNPGDKDGNGCVRAVPGKWCEMIHEEILSVELGKRTIYRIKSGLFPASYHRGYVSFEAIGESQTKVVWTVRMVPFACCGAILRFFCWFAFPNCLKALAKAAKKTE
mmetsp:Transcript_12251/g.19908  ORF Transcript_12251/g.19908 Transcript_12251/m.19908 type:complete len:170 (+) Transcript_12251:1119-1628(+)